MAGENVGFTYNFQKSAVHGLARCVGIGFSMEVVATESHARQHRAMYPHQLAPGKFYIKLEFMTYTEKKVFMDFLRGYARAMMDSSDDYHSPGMTVIVLGEDSDGLYFMRRGIPVAGINDGDYVGAAKYSATIVFETIGDPLDPTAINEQTGAGQYSEFVNGDNYAGGAQDDTTRFFYPMSPGSNNINVKAEDIYNFGNDPATGQAPVAPPAASLPGLPIMQAPTNVPPGFEGLINQPSPLPTMGN